MNETWDPALTPGSTVVRDGIVYVVGTGSTTNFPLIRGAQDDPASDDSGDDTEVDDSGGTDDASSEVDDDEEPEKKFSQKDVDRILAKEKNKALRGKIDPKELGFESKKELDDFIAAQKEKAEKDKTDAEREHEAELAKVRAEASGEATNKAKAMTLKAEFKLAAADAGVPRDRVDDAFALAQSLDSWEDVNVTDEGEVSGIDDDFFKELNEKKPWLFVEETDEGSDNGTPRGIGGGAHGKATTREARESELKTKYPALRRPI